MKSTVLKIAVVVVLLLHVDTICANDGAFYTSGNQLIPAQETDICITKEVLSIVKHTNTDGEHFAYVTVNYTFYNPVEDKTLIVGFEAPPPSGDAYDAETDTKNPFIHDFKVVFNNKQLPYDTKRVLKVNATPSQKESQLFKYANYYYAYYFTGTFKKGTNTITHTYKYKMAGSVVDDYSFDYILTAANRWANKQIDDFTLHINLGDNEIFSIYNSFFDNKADWDITNGKSISTNHNYTGDAVTQFVTYTGGITYKMKNFSPKKELMVYKLRMTNVFDYKYNGLPNFINASVPHEYFNEASYKVLRNLPYAIRGYIFKTPLIQDYYTTQVWYTPNPNYRADIKDLSPTEQKWLASLKPYD